MLTGYRRSGKDSFFRSLGEGWLFLGRRGSRQPLIPPTRVAFADILKRNFLSDYRLDIDIETLDRYKDTPALLIDPTRTYRDFLIEYAEYHRRISPDYWIQRAFPVLPPPPCTVTDWRYPNELEYLCEYATTIRIFRSGAGVPPEENEHLLDDAITDYVAIPSIDWESQQQEMVQLFPQYSDYVLCSSDRLSSS